MTGVIHFQLSKGLRFEPKPVRFEPSLKKEKMVMVSLIKSLISWALLLGVLGGLVDVTIALRKEAAWAHSIGLVSLGQLNRALLGGPRHRAPAPARDR